MRVGFIKSAFLLIIVLTAFAQFRFAMLSGFDADEIEHAHVAWLLSQGVKPYAEFHQIHSPLLWICLCPILDKLPESTDTLLMLRAICLLAFAGSCVAGYLMLRNLNIKNRTTAAALFALISIAVLGQLQLYRFRPDPFMALCVAWAIVTVQRIPSRTVLYSFLSGVLLGLGASFTPKIYPLCLLVPIMSLYRCRQHSSWRPIWLVLPGCIGFLFGLLPLLIWLRTNGILESFLTWVFLNNAPTFSNINWWPLYYLHGGAIFVLMALAGAVLLHLGPSRRHGPEWFAARTLVLGAILAWLIRLFHPNQLLYNLQAFAIPGAVLSAILLTGFFAADRLRKSFTVIAIGILFSLLYRPVVAEGIQLRASGLVIYRDELQALIDKTESDQATCVGFAPFHPLFCRDTTELYLVWDLRFAHGHKITEAGSKSYKDMWVESISEIIIRRPEIIVKPEYFEEAHNHNILSKVQFERIKRFIKENYVLERMGAVSYLVLSDSGDGGSPLTSHLRVDGFSDPLAVESALPTFSWFLHDPDRGEIQSAYQILVASDPVLLDNNKADYWDSGKVCSAESTRVGYQGLSLSGKKRYWWKVRAWDRTDTIGPYSRAACFEMGLQPQDWKAKYIWDGTDNDNNYCYFRKRFIIPARAMRGRAYLFAHDDYRFFINGQPVGRGPAPSDPYDSALYNAWDITDAVVEGENVMTVIAHYHGQGTGCGVKGKPAFILQAEIECLGGEHITLISDASWKVLAETPWNENSPCRGPVYAKATSVEDYDARLELNSWHDAKFNDSHWMNAKIVEPGYRLKAQAVPVEVPDSLIRPVRIDVPAPGIHLVDFGLNSTGWPVLAIDGAEAGQRIRIWYSEQKDGNRIVRNANEITDYYDQYTCKGGSETWEPDTKYNGFRYVEIEGYPSELTTDQIALKYVHTALNKEGAFNCSSPLLNRIYDICIRTQVNACQGILVDCPQREQTQYAADAVIQGLNLFYNFSYTGLHRKFLYDLCDSATKSGLMSSHHPSEAVSIIPEWMLHWPIGLWNQYLYAGDQSVLRDLFPTLQKLLKVFEPYRDAETGLLAEVPGRALSDHPLSTMDMNGRSLTPQNCLYFRALVIAADVAEMLGDPAAATAYKESAGLIRQGINKHLFNGIDRYRDCSGSNNYHALSSVFPLFFDIVPEERIEAVLDHVVSTDFEPSVYGGFYLCETLYRFDRDRHMYELLHRPGERWAKMLEEGATTTWEAWIPGASLSHAWSAYPMKFLLSGLLGIEPIEPGFSVFSIRPRVDGGLRFAEGTVPTPRGNIFLRWDKTAEGLRLAVEIPMNTKARIHIPALGSDNPVILESGRSVWEGQGLPEKQADVEGAAGVEFLNKDGGRISFTVGSGAYLFELIM